MLMKKITLFIAAIMASAAMFAEGTLSELFTYTTDQKWNESLFEATKYRDIDEHNGVLYVLKNGETRIVCLDAQTGEYQCDVNVEGVTGGAIALSSIQVLSDGTLLAMNCQTNCSAGDVKVYIWEDITAAPEVLYQGKLDEALRVDAFKYEGTLENGAIWTSYSGGTAGTTAKAIKIPITNGIAGEYESYILTNYAMESSSRVISVQDNLLYIACKGALYTWAINDDKSTTIKYYTTLGNIKYTNAVKFFEYDGVKYFATVSWNSTNGTKPQILVNSYNSLGRWGASGLSEVFKTPSEGLGGDVRNTSFFNGLDVVVQENGFAVYMSSINHGLTACQYVFSSGTTTALDNTIVAPQVEKIVRNGQVLIIRDGKTYNMMGQEVK